MVNSPQQYFNQSTNVNKSQEQQSASEAAPYSVHDTLTDLDAAISELSGANQQQNLQNIQQQQNIQTKSSAIPDVLSWQPEDVRNHFLSLGFDPSVCDCFIQHQITGPILLELDLAYLKEIDIPSFGMRFQISKVIKALNQTLNTGVVQDVSLSLSPSANASQQSLSQTHTISGNNININNTDNTNNNFNNNFNQNDNMSNESTNHGLMPAPVFKRQSILRTAKDNTRLNDHLSKNSTQEYQQDKSDSKHDFFFADNKQNPSVQSHKKESSFDRSWTVSKGQRLSETVTSSLKPKETQHQRLRSTTISTTDQYFHENRGSTDSNPVPPFNPTNNHNNSTPVLGSKQALASDSNKQPGAASHSHQISSDTVRGNNTATNSSNVPSNGNPILYFAHKHARSTSSLGLSDFKYLNKLTSDEVFNDDPAAATRTSVSLTLNRRPSSIVSVILTGENGDNLKLKKTATGTEPALVSDFEEDELKAKRIATNSNQSSYSFDSNNTGPAASRRPSQSQKEEGGSITPTTSVGKKKKGPLRSSSSHSNLRKSSYKKTRTSAFQEGIKSVTPTEAAKTSDYSGWMSKRGSAAVGTWKARFFTLHGTRLSYFSQFSDSREKGLIDITSHRVVPVGDEDKLVAMYAASVGAGRHCFKIIPPTPGSRKGVTFTVPKVHYFAVDNKEEMREWMNAIIKATIDRDDSVPVVSSCATPTVSLARAREMFAESRAKEDELRAKAVAETNNNIAQMALGSSLTGNNSVALFDSSNSSSSVVTPGTSSAATPSWLSTFGSNFYHANDGSSGENSASSPNNGVMGSGGTSYLNGTPSTPDSPAPSGSLRSSETSSSITRGSSVIINKHQPSHSGALGSLGLGFGSGSLGINPATLAGGTLSLNGNTNSIIIPATATSEPVVRHGKYSTEYPSSPLPAIMMASDPQDANNFQQRNIHDMNQLTQKTGGLKLVTEFN